MPSIVLPPDRSAASRARRFLGRHLADHGFATETVRDAELLVSELVTNAVLHASSPSTLDVEVRGGTIRVSVSDASPARPRLRDYGPAAVTGRGLLLVDRIASRWGVDRAADGKCVWFEIVTSPDTTPAREVRT